MISLRSQVFLPLIMILAWAGPLGPGFLGADVQARPTPAESSPWPATCLFPGLSLPPETEVYAVSGRGGQPLGWNIDHDQGRDPTLIKVAVNSPQTPVILILGAYEPNVWQIGWTEGTRILAVAVGGHYRQAVSGLRPDVPVLMGGWNGEPGRSPFCGPLAPVSGLSNDRGKMIGLSRHLFGLELKDQVAVKRGRALVGPNPGEGVKIMTSRNVAPGDFKTPSDFPEGEDGLTEALRRGLIKPASWVELRQWRRAALERKKREAAAEGRSLPVTFDNSYGSNGIGYLLKGYLVVSPDFVIPDRLKLSGNIGFNFFIPPGLDRPAGPLDKQTRLLFMADGTELTHASVRPGQR